MLNLGAFETKKLPYDDEQTGINEQVIIHFSHVVAENTPKGIAADRFAQLVKEKTDGQVIVQVYPNGILYNDETEYNALRDNSVQMIAPTFSKMSNLVPSWELLDLPFLIESEEQLASVLSGDLKTMLLEELNKHGIVGLDFWSNGFKQIAANNFPVLYSKDFYSLNIRVMNSNMLLEQMQLLGALPIITDFDDVFSLMESGQINAQENTISNIYSKGFHTYEKHITLSNHGIMGYAVIMNEAFWKNLKPQHQQAIQEALAEMQQWQFKQSKLINEASLNALRSIEGVQIYEPTAQQLAEWKSLLEPLYMSYRNNGFEHYYSILLEQLHEQN